MIEALFHRSRFTALSGAFGLLAGVAQAQVNCIPIDTIEVTGVTLLRAAETDAALAPFRGQCLDIDGINGALEAITFLYVDKGYVTARAYLPEQNIADRSLDITVVEGELSAVTFNGETRPLWEAIVFPDLSGKAANLREIEQGLEIIRAMPSYNATMEISAGAEEGQSVLEVTAVAERPWTARIGANNGGTPDNGEYVGTIDLTYDHLLGLNETWSLNLSRGSEEYPFSPDTGGAGTEAIGGSLRLPYGRWALTGNYRYSSYETDTLGPITAIGTDGWTTTADIGLSRVMHRNQTSKTTLSGNVEYRDNVNRIAEIEINASSRTLASARLDLEHERSVWGGSLTTRLGYEQGLSAFGAEEKGDPFSSANPQFSLSDFEISYFRPWQPEIGTLSLTSALRGQFSDDDLYGAYRFGLGGQSSVRGVKSWTNEGEPARPDPDGGPDLEPVDAVNVGLFTGNTGVVWRNDMAWSPKLELPSQLGRFQVYGALDAGVVDFDRSGAGKALSGGAIGMRTVGGLFSFDVAWQRLIEIDEETTSALSPVLDPDGIFVVSLSARF